VRNRVSSVTDFYKQVREARKIEQQKVVVPEPVVATFAQIYLQDVIQVQVDLEDFEPEFDAAVKSG